MTSPGQKGGSIGHEQRGPGTSIANKSVCANTFPYLPGSRTQSCKRLASNPVLPVSFEGAVFATHTPIPKGGKDGTRIM